VGMCKMCVARRTHSGNLASYWTQDWPRAWVKDVGRRQTWDR
jgi:hypothetical protein